ncbi:MAG: PKD domain-containing protein [Ferruginibacter sp.]
MKYISFPVILLCLFLFPVKYSSAQLFPGMKVNGRTRILGDTVNVCKGSSLLYETTATGFTSIRWQFQSGTPATSTSFFPQTIVYNTVGVDSTVQVISDGLTSDSMFIYVRVSDIKPTASYTFTPDNVCGNTPIAFTNSSSGLGNTYQWDFNDGTTVTTTSPSHQFLAAIGSSGSQTYNVKLVATNVYGCRDSSTKIITVQKIPDATIGNADPQVLFGPFNGVPTFRKCAINNSYLFQFSNQSSTNNANMSYTIQWGDNTPDTTFGGWPAATIIQHNYPIGNNIMTVRITGTNGCIGIRKYNVFLGTNPGGGFISLGNTDICAPDSLRFVVTGYNNNSPGTIYRVTVNDGATPEVFTHPPPDTVTHLFNFTSCGTSSSNGSNTFQNSFRATLDIENPCASTSVSVIPILVSGKPKAIINVSPDVVVCTGTNVFINDGGYYGGVVTATGGGTSTCYNTGKQVWTITPSTGYTINSGTMGSTNGSNSNGFVWTSGTPSLNTTFNTPGTYTIRLYIFNDRCGMDSTVRTICVRNPPQAGFTMDNRSACETGTAKFTNTSSSSGACLGDNYTWAVSYIDGLGCGGSTGSNYDFINGTSSSSAEPQIQFNVPGKYIIELTAAAVGSNSCTPSTKRDTFTVKGKPKVVIDPIASICANNTISPTATVSGCYADSVLKYSWTFTNGTPASSVNLNPGQINYTALGTHPIQLTVTSECGLVPATSSVDITAPQVVNAGSDTIICQSTNSLQFTGTPAGGTWSGSSSVTAAGEFTPSVTGIVQLVYSVGSGTCTVTDTMAVTVNAGITNNIINPSQSVCINTQPAIITGQPATGGDGTPAYQWQQSTDSVTWGSITGETGLDYTPPVLTATTFYRRIAYTTLCSGVLGSFSDPVKITIREDANADLVANPPTGCPPFDLGKVITVNTYSDRNGQYQWYADGVSIGSNPLGLFPGYIMQNSNDTVIIKLVTTSPFGCKPDSMEQQFITFKTSVAKFEKGNAKGCSPLIVPFTNTSNIIDNSIQFFWDFGNGVTSTAAQPGSIQFNTSQYFNDTTYYVTLKAFGGCDTTVWRDSVEVRTSPKSRFGVSTTSGCSPLPLQINNTSLGGPNTYYWDFGNGDVDTTFTTGSFNYTYNTGTLVDTFAIRLIATNECGSDTSTIDIRIAPNIIIPQVNISGSELYGCAPHIVNFINSTDGATGYRWDFNDGTPVITTSNNERRVVHTYTLPGDYNVKIDITNGCSDTTVFRPVTVYAKPNADFITNASVYCLGDTVKVTNRSADASNYRWFWGDGQTDAGDAPVHVYTIAGNYDILLRAERVNNFGVVCFDTLVVPISLQVKPDVALQSNINLSNCAPFVLTVAAPAIINENVDWYFYDTTVTPSLITANGVSAQYTFNNAGTFKVKMIASNAFGCKDSTERTFTVRATPQASFTPGDLAVCKTDTIVSYQNTTVYNDNGPLSYRWLVDGTQFATTGNFTHRYTAAGGTALPRSFSTLMIATNTVGCSDTVAATLQLNPVPDAQFSIVSTNNCVPFIPAVVDNSAYVTDYRWLLNGQFVSADPNPSVEILQPSTAYTFTLVGNNIYGCKADSFTVNFTSRIKPDASFTVNDTLGCSGALNVATNNQTRFANSYTWDWGDGSPTVAFNSPTHLYNTIGSYVISLIASDGVCRDTALQPVTVSTKPIVDFAATPLVSCDTARVQFSNLSQNAVDFNWDFGNGTTSNSTNPFVNLAPKNSSYSIKLVAYNGSCRDSLIKPNYILAKIPPAGDFIINPSPIITIPNYTFSFTNLTPNSNKYTYQWDLDDGTFATTRDVPDHKYADTGNYYIRLIVLDTNMNCQDTVIKIARIDGIPGYLYVPNAFYPNSIQTQFRSFKPLGKGLADYHLQIFDNWGKLLFESRELDATGAPVAAWDGTFKGAPVAQDTYVWKINARFKNGKQWDGMVYTNLPGKKTGVTFGTLNLFR